MPTKKQLISTLIKKSLLTLIEKYFININKNIIDIVRKIIMPM